MKRFSGSLGLLLMGLASSPTQAGCGCGMASCGGGAPAYSNPVAVDWRSFLKLDESQAKKLDQTFQAEGVLLQTLQQKRKDLLAQLQLLAGENVVEKSRIGDLQKRIRKAQQEMERSRYQLWDQIAGFLTPAQRAKFIFENTSRWPMQDLLATIQSAEIW